MTRLGFGTSFRIFSWGGSPWHLTPKPVPRGASSATDSDVHVFACAPSQSRAASFTQPYRWISGSERCSNPIERSGPLAQRKDHYTKRPAWPKTGLRDTMAHIANVPLLLD